MAREDWGRGWNSGGKADLWEAHNRVPGLIEAPGILSVILCALPSRSPKHFRINTFLLHMGAAIPRGLRFIPALRAA